VINNRTTGYYTGIRWRSGCCLVQTRRLLYTKGLGCSGFAAWDPHVHPGPTVFAANGNASATRLRVPRVDNRVNIDRQLLGVLAAIMFIRLDSFSIMTAFKHRPDSTFLPNWLVVKHPVHANYGVQIHDNSNTSETSKPNSLATSDVGNWPLSHEFHLQTLLQTLCSE
jgi:hypothetical protein